MPRREREKGKRYEREVAKAVRAAGFDAERTGWHQSHGLDVADVTCSIPGVWLEAKHQERILIEQWCRQAEAAAPEGVTPVVVWRRSRQPSRVTLPFYDFLAMQRKLNAMQRKLNGGGD